MFKNILFKGLLLISLITKTVYSFNDSQCNLSPSMSRYRSYLRTNNNIESNTNNILRIMQYNVEWLFTNEYNDCPGNGCTWINTDEAFKHLEVVQQNINKVQPSIIHFCEMEGCDELNYLRSNITGVEYNPYLIFGKDTSTGQNVGLLSRVIPLMPINRTDDRFDYPIEGSTCGYTGSTGSEGVSKNLYTRFQFGEITFLYIGAHLLANPTDPTRCAEREAQAQVLQNLLVKLIEMYPDDEIILLGDFNDYDGEFQDINNHTPMSKVLRILKGYYGVHKNAYRLYTVASLVDKSKRYTNWWDSNEDCITTENEYSMLDHILVSKGLYEKIIHVEFYHKYEEFCGKYDSDHWPIIVDFGF
jgi:exonuclease III